MSPAEGGRRYSDEEFALILRLASEDEANAELARPHGGLTLTEIQQVAAEVGIAPERISQAAAFLPSGEGGAVDRLLGGALRLRYEHAVPGVIPAAERSRVMDVARRALSTEGEAREVMGGVEWKGGTGSVSVTASIRPRDGETGIRVSADRTEAAVGIYGAIGATTTCAISLFMVKLVVGETDAGIVAGLVSGLVPGLLLARTVWRKSTRSWKDRLLRLMSTMSQEAEAVVARSGGEPDGSRSEEDLATEGGTADDPAG